jgi:hypothetical protein
VSFKKGNPGCPCDCGDGGGGICGCSATQFQVDIENATDTAIFYGTRFSPGPCNAMEFDGFSALNGTYIVEWPETATIIELGRWASTSGKQFDGFGNAYCAYMKVELITTSGSLPCNGQLIFTLYFLFLADPTDPCPDVDDVSVWGADFTDEFSVGVSLCISESDEISIQTVTGQNAIDCGAEFWTADVTVGPV